MDISPILRTTVFYGTTGGSGVFELILDVSFEDEKDPNQNLL
jgi:hypothetical protein